MPTTCCPYCQTRFRVTEQQLTLRLGMVRCGTCKEVFDGRTDPGVKAVPAATPPAQAAEAEAKVEAEAEAEIAKTEPTDNAPNLLDELDALSTAITNLQNTPWRETAMQHADPDEALYADEPKFVYQTRKKKRGARVWKVLLWLGLPLLLLAFLAQLVFHFRDEIAARSPQAAPYLQQACAQLGCSITLPAQISALSLQSSQLQILSGQENQFELIVLLRNQSDSVQAWPALELQLKDEASQLLVRKAFLPVNFVKPDEMKLGIAAHSEREIRVPFLLSGPPAADFQVTLFYH
jgi:predicted Zn finger-like uncharacterized protein